MRRILHKKPSVAKYLQMQRDTGFYPKTFDPEALEILTLNPPLPVQPKPHYESLKEFKIRLPTDRLVKKYLQKIGSSSNTEDAYDFAVKQLDFMQKNVGKVSEEESFDYVDKLMRAEAEREKIRARAQRVKVCKRVDDLNSHKLLEDIDKEVSPSALFGDSEAAKTMAIYGDYLARTPYYKWTIGAATALDHWIAVKILGLSERTWQMVLQGECSVDAEASDIEAVRSALFPETTLDNEEDYLASQIYVDDDDDIQPSDDEDEDDVQTAAANDGSIDDLLASLRNDGDDMWKTEDEAISTSSKTAKNYDVDDAEIKDVKKKILLEEMEVWQKKNEISAHIDWNDIDKKELNTWLEEYVTLYPEELADGLTMSEVKDKVLSADYVKMKLKNENEAFLEVLNDDQNAEIMLDKLHENYETISSSKVTENETEDEKMERQALSEFMKLSREEQVEQLREWGSLQPLLSNTSTSTVTFGEDEDDKAEAIAEEVDYKEYAKSAFVTSKALNVYRQMRANHEEKLFEAGHIGITYSERNRRFGNNRKSRKY